MNTRIPLLAIALSILLITSCDEDIPLPDLDPNSEEGSEMLVFDIGDAIVFSSNNNGDNDDQFGDVYREYDVNNDGVIDIRIRGRRISQITNMASDLNLVFNGEVLYTQSLPFLGPIVEPLLGMTNTAYVVPLPANALIGGSIASGQWAPRNELVSLGETAFWIGTTGWDTEMHVTYPGLSYIATRTQIGGNYYYGWIEVGCTDLNDGDTNEILYISRYAFSTTPGLRVRMGQE